MKRAGAAQVRAAPASGVAARNASASCASIIQIDGGYQEQKFAKTVHLLVISEYYAATFTTSKPRPLSRAGFGLLAVPASPVPPLIRVDSVPVSAERACISNLK
jgi:hypothetical protein